ncbi:MAG: hypothetical protein JEZ11_14690 [Desulfobacterales bacterium]|nr:hypothetical protein [Desulfobacterales bacterium]
MPQIVILTERVSAFDEMARRLADAFQCQTDCASSIGDVDLAFGKAPDLLVIDAMVDGSDALAVARQVIAVNAMINMAVVSDLSEDDFHEASEGLGIMARIPASPGAKEADMLVGLLKQMPGFDTK